MNLNNFSSPTSETSTGSKNLLTEDVVIKGTISFEKELIFDGTIEGQIISTDGMLTLGKNARVQGEVHTKAITVHGTVDGNITVTEKCELKASSQLTGDLRATRILIEEGATFVGKSEVTPGKAITRDASRSLSAASNAPSQSSSSAPASSSSASTSASETHRQRATQSAQS